MANETDRGSQPGLVPEPPILTEEERALLEAQNGFRQFDRMLELIQEATVPGAKFRLRPSTLMELNRHAVEGMMIAPGSFRNGPIGISGTDHSPPPPEEVPSHIDSMCEYIMDNWGAAPVHLAAYLMWRLNWIHPFRDGNGRTSRVVSYLVLCASLGYRIPGTKTIPERIADNKQPYYAALDAADAAWTNGNVDVSEMEKLIGQHLAAQLVDIHHSATGQNH